MLSHAHTQSGKRRSHGGWKRRSIRMSVFSSSEVIISPHIPSAGGRIKAGCDLISHYIPPSVYTALLASYEFVICYICGCLAYKHCLASQNLTRTSKLCMTRMLHSPPPTQILPRQRAKPTTRETMIRRGRTSRRHLRALIS
jgi:hypothetical protein